MLIERILDEIPEAYNLQVNTDGATFMIPRKDLDHAMNIKERWEKYTNLSLEETIYEKMVILNVSNYIALSESGKVKRKGTTFIYKDLPGELEIYKNHSALVVPKTLENYFINNLTIEESFTDCIDNNLRYFFLRSKIKKSDRLVARSDSGDQEIQRISRYIVTGELIKTGPKEFEQVGTGVQLIKIMKPLKGTEPREINLESGYLCTVINDLNEYNHDEIVQMLYLPYYESKVKKVINSIENESR